MAYQIVYFDRDGQRAREHALECATDDEALERLARVRHSHALELWCDERLVWRFDARD